MYVVLVCLWKAATFMLNLIVLTFLLSLVNGKKKCDLGYNSSVPFYPEYAIIRVTKRVQRPYPINEDVPLCLYNYFSGITLSLQQKEFCRMLLKQVVWLDSLKDSTFFIDKKNIRSYACWCRIQMTWFSCSLYFRLWRESHQVEEAVFSVGSFIEQLANHMYYGILHLF